LIPSWRHNFPREVNLALRRIHKLIVVSDKPAGSPDAHGRHFIVHGESYRLKQSKARRRIDPHPADETADPETGEITPAS